MPWQPCPKMHMKLDVSQVRSHLNTWSPSAGSTNSTYARGNTRSTSGTRQGYVRLRGLYRGAMRLGVLDIGSNTGHLLVFDAHDGAAPLPAYSHKEPLRLAEHLDDDGAVTEPGIDALAGFVSSALVVAEDKGCEEMLPFATSAVRDAANPEAVLATV